MSSKTGENRKPGTFTKADPRINRKGRPTTFGGLRELAQQIAHEKARDRETKQPIVAEGHALTIGEAILRQWAVSKNPKLQQQFIEVAFGKVPNVTQITGAQGGPVEIKDVTVAESEVASRIDSLAARLGTLEGTEPANADTDRETGT